MRRPPDAIGGFAGYETGTRVVTIPQVVMAADLHHLEQALLKEPFNLQLRAQYAAALASIGRHQAAAEQWALVTQQNGKAARPHIELAYCLNELGQTEAAAKHLVHARQCADYDDVQLELDLARRSFTRERHPPPLRHGAQTRAAHTGEGPSVLAVPKTRFRDIAGIDDIEQTLRRDIVERVANPRSTRRGDDANSCASLLYGPPGCGKTMIARAVATECNASFTAIALGNAVGVWGQASRRNLAAAFEKARQEQRALLFFDDIDALTCSSEDVNAEHARTMLDEFSNQLDEPCSPNAGLIVLAATSAPWDMDEVLSRAGRFPHRVFVPPPNAETRRRIFELELRDLPVGALDTAALAAATVHFSGSDIAGVIERAKQLALARAMSGNDDTRLEQTDLLEVIGASSPSITEWVTTARRRLDLASGGYEQVENYLLEPRL